VPIIIVSARADEVDRVLGLEMGADDCVVKPFSLKELAARVKVALRRLGGAARLSVIPRSTVRVGRRGIRRLPAWAAHVGERIAPTDEHRLEDPAAYLVRNPSPSARLHRRAAGRPLPLADEPFPRNSPRAGSSRVTSGQQSFSVNYRRAHAL
jgi:hypothetical protein